MALEKSLVEVLEQVLRSEIGVAGDTEGSGRAPISLEPELLEIAASKLIHRDEMVSRTIESMNEDAQPELTMADDGDIHAAREYFTTHNEDDDQLEGFSVPDEALPLIDILKEAEYYRAAAEYAGELVLGMFTMDIEIEDAEQTLGVVGMHLFNEMKIEAEGTIIFEALEKECSQYVATLSIKQAEATQNIVEALAVAVKGLPASRENMSEDIASLEQGVELLCRELFDSLGLEYDDEIIKQFIKTIVVQTQLRDRASAQLSIDKLNYLGTYEYRSPGNPSLLGNLTQPIWQKLQPYFALGKYALRNAVP